MTHLNLAMTTLLNGIWEGTLLTVAMWLFLKLLPKLNPTTRFTVLWVTLLATVALLLAPFTPRVSLPAAQPDSPAFAAPSRPATTTPAAVQKAEPKLSAQNPHRIPDSHAALQAQARPKPASAQDYAQARQTEPALQSSQVRNRASESRSAAIAPAQHPLIRIHSGKILAAVEILWALVTLGMVLRLALGYRKLRGLKAHATQAPAEWQLRLKSLSQINGVRRQTQLLVSGHIAAPMSLGFLNPAILIPRALLDTLSDSELEHVVLHELGHLRRRDDWTNLAQKLIEAMLPIQPAVYWIGRRMALEREMACDDWVIAATGTAEPYAASLTRVAELSQWARAGILAAGATGNRSQLFSRVHHMLDRTRNAAPRLAIGPLGAAIAAIGLLIYLGARAPQMIAFAQTSENQIGPQAPISISLPHAPQAAPAPVATPAALWASTASPTPAPVTTQATAVSTATPTAAPTPTAPAEPGETSASPVAPVLLASSASLSSLNPPVAPPVAQQSSETHTEMTTRDGFTSLSMKVDGAIEFTDDDRDVKSLSPRGHFRIEEGTWLSGRVYDVKADSAGNLTKTYSVGSSVKPLDAEGLAWLQRLLPQMIRDSGIGAGPRVARFLRQGGPQAVINEIGLIRSDGSKRIYVEQLFAQSALNTEQLKEAARLIRGISSDGDKAQALMAVDGKYFVTEVRPNLFEAVESIHSDGDKRRVLSDILNKDAGSADTLLSVARAAKHISSDGDKSEVLIEMADSYRESGGLGMAYFEAAKSVSSDGDHARVLSAMLAARGDSRETLSRVLESAQKISSDGDKARVLKEAVARFSEDEFIRKAFLDAANSISSDGDHQQVLVALAHRQGIGSATVGGIAKSAQRISSDGDKARVLTELIADNVEPVADEFFASADSIHSDGDHSHVLLTLLDKSGTSSAMAIGAIQSATHISSDGDRGHVLLEAAHRYSKDPKVDAALRKAVESLHSDGVYRSVMSEIARSDPSN
jgi:beta-lactamase regulating signal transducer with metallopeptidase domain